MRTRFPRDMRSKPSSFFASLPLGPYSSIKLGESNVADSLHNASDGRILIQTSTDLACIDEKKTVLWCKPINDRFRTCAVPLLEKQSVFYYADEEIKILDELTGKEKYTCKAILNTFFTPLVMSTGIVVFSIEKDVEKISFYNFELEKQWDYALLTNFEVRQFFNISEQIMVVLDKKVVTLNQQGQETHTRNFDNIQRAFQLSNNKLFVKDANGSYIYQGETDSLENYSLNEPFEGKQTGLFRNEEWIGFVSNLHTEREKHGNYNYPIGLFNQNGDCTKIVFKQPVQDILVDSYSRIIVMTGEHAERYHGYHKYIELKYTVHIFSEFGQALEQIEMKNPPQVGPMLITNAGELACYSNGNLHFYSSNILEKNDVSEHHCKYS